MRKALDRQRRLDCPSVTNVSLNLHCRNESIPILRALQHIYSTPKVRDAILRAIARDVNGKSKATRGRPGLSYWEILVLAGARLGCGYNHDELQDLAENHRALRQVMGIGDWETAEKDQKRFDWRRIESNVNLLRPETIHEINQAIIEEGHRLQPQAAETVRGDSFVVQTNIHYPTDSSLIADGLRKVLGLAVMLAGMFGLIGWRQHKHLYRKVKRLVREIDRLAARKGSGYQARLQSLYAELLDLAAMVLERAERLPEHRLVKDGVDLEVLACHVQLKQFMRLTRQVCGTATRRVLEGQSVPNRDKLFSLFETHTQLYKRGKAAEPVQFGRQVLVYEDAAGFITHAYLMPRQEDDRDVVVGQTRALQQRLDGRIRQASFDRGFHSPENQRDLAEIIPHPCLPKPGANQAAEQQQQATVEFRQSRQRHPGIESAINALQSGNGLERCRDRTEHGFSRYLQLGVLGRNLHVLGKGLLAAQDAQCQAARSQRKKSAA